MEERPVACHNTCVAVVALERCVLRDPYVLSVLKRIGMSFAGPLHQLAMLSSCLGPLPAAHLTMKVCVMTLHRPRLGANAPLHKP